jgi:lipopolysaccharide transport system permease protein
LADLMSAQQVAVAVPRPRSRTAVIRRIVQVVMHLTAREFRIRYQSAVLGWLWALVPTAVRFVVLAIVFSILLTDPGPDYLAQLAVGILAWNWFAVGVASATTSASDRRDLLTQPALPRQVLPVISILTDAFDYLAGLPVLLVIIVIDTGDLPATAVLLVPLLALQGCLILGLGMAASVADVRWRDSRRAVELVLSVGIYVTPVFYTGELLSEKASWLVDWNPVAALLEAQRDVLVRGVVPGPALWAGLTAVCLGALAGGWTLHRRSSATFLDFL